jgi:hypothetical protein
MKITLDIEKITVLLSNSSDQISIQSNLPSSYPGFCSENMTLKIEAGHGQGIDYVKEHFGIEPEVINTRR